MKSCSLLRRQIGPKAFEWRRTYLFTVLTSKSFASACSMAVESSQKVAMESAPAVTIIFSSDETASAHI